MSFRVWFVEAEVHRDKRIKGDAEEVGSKVFEKSSREALEILQKRIPRPLIATA